MQETETKSDLGELFCQASRTAIRRAIRIHVALDVPMVEWRDGQVVEVQPDDPLLQAILDEEHAN